MTPLSGPRSSGKKLGKIGTITLLPFLFQDTIRNPSVMDFIDRSLDNAPFSSKHILNFLHNGPPEDRPDDVPDFDWRDIFNLTDRVIRMLNQYGDVSVHC